MQRLANAFPAMRRIDPQTFQPQLALTQVGQFADRHDLPIEFDRSEPPRGIGQPLVEDIGDVIAIVPGAHSELEHARLVVEADRAEDKRQVAGCRCVYNL